MDDAGNSLTSNVTVATLPARPADIRLSSRYLVITRAAWALITSIVLGLVLTGTPIRYERVRTAAPDLRAPEFRDLIGAGVAPEVAAAGDVAVGILLFLAVFVGGILLFLRAAHSREATFLSLTLILYGTGFSALTSVHRSIGPPFSQSLAGLLTTAEFFLGTSLSTAAMFWLPAGRFTSLWTAGFTSLVVMIMGGLYFFVNFPRSHDLVNIVGLPAVVVGVWFQVSHYRRVADPVMRQQIKWAVFGIVAAGVGFLISQIATLFFGGHPGLASRIGMVGARLFMVTCQIATPVGFAIAIMRYRLWQVDLVINRSLVYGTVSVFLASVFVAGGFALQSIVGQRNSPIAFAISTAGAGLLFNPARRYAQRLVDRRLYGFRFDLNELNRAQQLPDVKNPGALTGRRLGKCHVLGVLGRGGMGEVYHGEADDRRVAIKVLPPDLTQRDFLKWFERESQTLASVDHPNIVKFYESGESDGVYYMVLEFVNGRALSDIIRERGRIPFDEVRPFIRDVATALDYAHRRGLVHRDIKPSNIMVRRKAGDTALEAVLMDFGIAKTNEARTALTSTGAIGTINYMAPEQIMAAKTIDGRADIYSLGVTVYEMLTGELPFRGNPAQVLFAHLQQQPTDPRQLVPNLPAHAARTVMRAMQKKAEDRFQSATEFAAALTVQ